ncbi:hypothetical protein [Hymenobacter cavernae]|nr:hypothetical protein [Hymenobacter cavernae]
MLATFDPLVFVKITLGSFMLGYIGCMVLQGVFGFRIGRRK